MIQLDASLPALVKVAGDIALALLMLSAIGAIAYLLQASVLATWYRFRAWLVTRLDHHWRKVAATRFLTVGRFRLQWSPAHWQISYRRKVRQPAGTMALVAEAKPRKAPRRKARATEVA